MLINKKPNQGIRKRKKAGKSLELENGKLFLGRDRTFFW